MEHILGLQTLTFVGSDVVGAGNSSDSGTCSSASGVCTSVTSGSTFF